MSPQFSMANDGMLHWQRINELSQDIIHFKWPAFNSYTSFPGLAMSTSYPWLSLLPLSLLNLFVKPLTVAKIFISGLMIFGFNIGYYSGRTYWKDKGTSLIFAIMICETTLFVMLPIYRDEFSGGINIAIEPLAIIGFLHLIRNGRWKMLAIGVSLMMYSHLISSVILVVMLTVLAVLLWKCLDRQKLINLMKSAVVALLATTTMWMPMLVLNLTNNIDNPPSLGSLANSTFLSFAPIRLANADAYAFSLTGLAALFFGLFHWKYLSYINKRLLSFGSVLLFMNTALFPWHLFDHTFLVRIQGVYRFAYFAYIIIGIATAPSIYREFKKIRGKCFSMAILLLSLLLCNFYTNMYFKSGLRNPTNPLFIANPIWNNRTLSSYNDIHVAYNNDYLPKTLLSHYNNSYSDYARYLRKHFKHIPKHVPINAFYEARVRNEQEPYIMINNGIKSDNHSDSYNVRMPIATYHAQKYNFYLDGHKFTPKKFKCSEPVISKLPMGRHRITYHAPLMWYRYIAMLMTAIGIVGLCYRRKQS